MSQHSTQSKLSSLWRNFLIAVKGTEKNFTSGSINRAIFMLSVPMVLEMIMESLFAIVDIYFVGKVSVNAVATVALTESIIMLVFAIAIGLSMSATAMVARRIGEEKPEEASHAAGQAIILSVAISLVFSLAGVFFAQDILRLMGAESELISEGYRYTAIMLGGNATIMLIFLINAVFRGAGDASIAMHSLWIANILNMILDPIFIFGLGPIPAFGVEGAAIATTIGRGTGVLYQLYALSSAKSVIRLKLSHLKPNLVLMGKLIMVSLGGIGQYVIGTMSWLFIIRISAIFGSGVLAGYQVAFRIIMFTILPSWGMSNAAATLVGQNLGAKQPERAEESVWKCAFLNMVFLAIIAVVFIAWAEYFVMFFSPDAEVVKYGAMGLRYISFGYIAFAYGMVISQAFNGAGDTGTPTWINFVSLWLLGIPLTYWMGVTLDMGPKGIFIAIAIMDTVLAAISIIIFRRGRWKTVQV
ncbi:MAG: MATE family efflux transporter [Bacteroidota bacterium]